jgi:hypothetical protein
MNSVNSCNRSQYVIEENFVKKFESIDQNQAKQLVFKNFLSDLIKENRDIACGCPKLYSRFFTVVSKIAFPHAQKKAVLSFFRKKMGLPDDSFENDVVLKGKNEASILCSKYLLEAFFEFFRVLLNSNLKESKSNK